MTVVDDSIHIDEGEDGVGLSVVIFRPDESLFPAVHSEDDIVQFRHMRVQTFQGGLQAISTNWAAFTVFSRNEKGYWVARPERVVEEEERKVLDRLTARTGHTAAIVRSSPRKPLAGGRPTLTIDLLQPDTFFDLTAEVVRVVPSMRSEQMSLLLTDYTANPTINADPTHFRLPSDMEHRLLLTTFWDNFASRVEDLREGQFVRILNLRSKTISGNFDGDYGAGNGGLVAVLHGDRSNSEKIFVLHATSKEASIIMERRRKLFGEDDSQFQTQVTSPKKAVIPRIISPSKVCAITTNSSSNGGLFVHPPSPVKQQLPLTCISIYSHHSTLFNLT